VAASTFKARFASGTKPVVIHDDHQALILGMQLIGYLEKLPKREPTKIIQSTKPETKGEIVSPKTRGSDIADGAETGLSKAGKPRKRGQFKQKQPTTLDELEDSRGRGNQTRMNGNGSD
jgi:hypothetical protein